LWELRPHHWLVIADPNVEFWATGRVGRFDPNDLRDRAAKVDLNWLERRHTEFVGFREAVTSVPLPQ